MVTRVRDSRYIKLQSYKGVKQGGIKLQVVKLCALSANCFDDIDLSEYG